MKTDFQIASDRIHSVMDIPNHATDYSVPVAKRQAMYLQGYIVALADFGIISDDKIRMIKKEVNDWLSDYLDKHGRVK